MCQCIVDAGNSMVSCLQQLEMSEAWWKGMSLVVVYTGINSANLRLFRNVDFDVPGTRTVLCFVQ